MDTPSMAGVPIIGMNAEPNQTIMSEREALAQRRQQSLESDYYAVIMMNEHTRELVRVFHSAYALDADRRIILNQDGTPKENIPEEVGLNVCAACGGDDHTLLMVMRGPEVKATDKSVVIHLQGLLMEAAGLAASGVK